MIIDAQIAHPVVQAVDASGQPDYLHRSRLPSAPVAPGRVSGLEAQQQPLRERARGGPVARGHRLDHRFAGQQVAGHGKARADDVPRPRLAPLTRMGRGASGAVENDQLADIRARVFRHELADGLLRRFPALQERQARSLPCHVDLRLGRDHSPAGLRLGHDRAYRQHAGGHGHSPFLAVCRHDRKSRSNHGVIALTW
jgi:hypothetical protein